MSSNPPGKRRVVISRLALADLADIEAYSVEEWGEKQAKTYMRRLYAAIEMIAELPGIGKSLDHLRPNYRSLTIASHNLVYRVTGQEDDVDLARILHVRRDLRRHLE